MSSLSTAQRGVWGGHVNPVDDFQERLRAYIDAVVVERCSRVSEELLSAIRRQVVSGKLVRPTASFLVARMLCPEIPVDPLLAPLAALELVHRSTLIHDDLIDGAKQRNGVACIHVERGMRAAVLAANLVHDLGISMCAAEVSAGLSAAALELTQGQLADVSEGRSMRSNEELLAEFEETAWAKSGVLGGFALQLGALVAHEDSPPHCADLARCLGLAYQLCDDLEEFDRWLTDEAGRWNPPDIVNRTRTYPALLVGEHREGRTDIWQHYMTQPAGSDISPELRQVAREYDPRADVAGKICSLLDSASSILDSYWPPGAYRGLFARLALHGWPRQYLGSAWGLVTRARNQQAGHRDSEGLP